MGRLEISKGIEYLIKAFASLPQNDHVLVIAGDGSLKNYLENLAIELGIQHQVRFTGYISIDQSIVFYSIAYVSVLPSVSTPNGKEPWGLVVNEALNQGLPVIASDAVGAAAGGLIKDGENGFIVPERDYNALEKALEKILSNPALREGMSENARRIILTWNNENMVHGFRQAIQYVTSPLINK